MHQDKSNKQNISEQRDPLFDYFRDNLEDFQLPVNSKCWENISQQINVQHKKKNPLILWGKVAAVLLLLIIPATFYFWMNNSNELESIYQNNPEIEFVSTDKQDTIFNNHLIISDNSRNDKKDRKYIPVDRRKNESDSLTAIADPVPDSKNDLPDSKKILDRENSAQKDVSNDSERKQDDGYFDRERRPLLVEAVTKNKNKWTLSASIGTSKSKEGSNDIKPVSFINREVASAEYGSPTNAKFSVPFSVGVSVRKQLNNTFSIESGVTYSYLSTEYKDQDNNLYPTTLKLHYIGIPVNVVTNIYQPSKQFKIYASVGVMAEKGIKANLSQKNTDVKQTINKSNSIDGLQWSLNGSLGASYSLLKEWSIYVEPRVSYYFDNRQPISIRTEKQTVVSINSGIRYEF